MVKPTRRTQATLVAGLVLATVATTATTAGAAAPHAGRAPAALSTLRSAQTRQPVRVTLPRKVTPPATPTPPTTPPVTAATPTEMPYGGIFGATSVWKQDVATAPVAPGSAAMVRDLVAHVSDRYGGVAAFNAHQFTTPFATASATTPSVDVAFYDCQGKGYTPPGLTGAGGEFTDVPVPADAVPAAGTDRFLAVWSPSRDALWEFWEMQKTTTGWSACWGGRIDHVSTAAGYFSGGFGASASGLAVSDGAVELSEVRAGSIPHALALDIPDTAAWPTVSYPAQGTDGGDTDASAIPEGTRLRLDPSIDVDAIPGLSPIARIIAHTAQKYGFIVTDTGGAVSVSGEAGTADQAKTGVDPWTALEGGLPDYLVMQGFPWQDLQALPQSWGKPAS